MLKKVWQIFFFIIILSGVALIQSSFVFNLPAAFSQINLIVIVLVFTLFFFGFRPALYAAVVLGFWLDIFSFYFFGLHIFLFLATVIFANWILSVWLTNRSLYSFLLLIFMATVTYDFALALLFFLSGASMGGFFLWRGSFWLDLFYQVIWSGLAGLLMFNLAGILTRRFQPFFLETK